MVDGGQVGIRAVPDFSGFGSLLNSGIRSSLTQAEGLGKQLSTALGGGLKTGVVLGTAAAGIAIGDFVSSGVKHFLTLTDQARQLERVTGGTAEEVSTFAGVIRKLGGDVDSTNRPLGLFASNIATHPDLFKQAGVAVAKYKDGTTDVLGTLDNLRKQFVGTADATQRDAVAKQLLGRGYQTLLPYLTQTNVSLDEYKKLARQSGDIVTQADIDKAREYKIHVAEVKDEVEGLKTAAGRKAVGLGDEIFQGLDVYSKIRGSDILKSFTSLDPLAFARGAIKEHDAEQGVKDAFYASAQAARDEALAINALSTEEKSAASAAEGVRSAQEGLTSAREAVTRAEQGVAKAHQGTQRAAEQEGKAEQNLADLLAKGPVDAKAVESARQGLESANRGVASSTEALATAEEHLVEVQQFESVDAANELTSAHLQLSQATLQLAQARLSASRAVPTLNDPFAQRQAQLQVRQATLAQSQAQENLTKLTQFGTQADRSATDAQKQVRDATQGVNDSLRQQADAQQKLNEAQAGDPDFQKKIADAKQQVADAQTAVNDAQQSEVDARQSVVDAKQAETDANYRVRDAQYALDDAVKASTTDQATMIAELEQKYPELAGIVEQSYGRIAHAATNVVIPDPTGQGLPGALYDPTTGKLIPTGPMGTPVPRRAAGGSVAPGQTYLVGEQGPEFLRDGKVYPSGHAPPQVQASGGSSDSYNITVNLNGASMNLSDPAQRRAIAERLAEETHVALSRLRRSVAGRK